MNYKLPIVEKLKEIGFNFQYDTLKKATDYMINFVKNNRDEIVYIIIPEFDLSNYEELAKETDAYYYPNTREILHRMIRLKDIFNNIEKSDYYFKIHPKYKNDRDVLYNFWKNQYFKLSVDSRVVLYDQSLFGITDSEAIDLVFYNELLRLIIKKLPESEFKIGADPLAYINSEIYELNETIRNYKHKNSKLMDIRWHCLLHRLDRCYDQKYEEMFSQNQSVEQKAVRIFYKILDFEKPNSLHKCTSISEKEAVLRYYLKKQSEKVVKSKNTRGTGLNRNRADKIIEYTKNNPNASIKQVADALNVNWRTAKKYMS